MSEAIKVDKLVTQRDHELAMEACRNWARDGAFIHGEVAKMIATARMEERECCRLDVIAFCAPWAITYARDRGLPEGHLHPTHYDILERYGARMDGFVRGED
jgi:hypothetical protein